MAHQPEFLPVGVASEREAVALSMRLQGATLAEIGRRLGVSRSQARIVLEKAKRKKDMANADQMHNASQFLGQRAVNVLKNEGIDISDPEAHVKTFAIGINGIKKLPNCGEETSNQIYDWLESCSFDIRQRNQEPVYNHKEKCPRCGRPV